MDRANALTLKRPKKFHVTDYSRTELDESTDPPFDQSFVLFDIKVLD